MTTAVEICKACGLVMGDREQHARFHKGLKGMVGAVEYQAGVIKQLVDSLQELAPLLVDIVEKIEGPPPPGIARELERLLGDWRK